MSYFLLYRISAVLLALSGVAHTLGGMLRMAKRGPGAGAKADEVLSAMKTVHFFWRGTDCTWFAFWMGNGLGVSSLLLLAVVVLWVLGGLDIGQARALWPIAWAMFVSLALLTWLGFKYFSRFIGSAFGLIALLTGIGALFSTFGAAQ